MVSQCFTVYHSRMDTEQIACCDLVYLNLTLSVHHLFTVCSPSVYCLFTICLLFVHHLFTVCSPSVYCLFAVCLLYVHYSIIVRLLPSYCLFTTYSPLHGVLFCSLCCLCVLYLCVMLCPCCRVIPEEVRSLKNLEVLDLRMNEIEGSLPQSISLLPRLSRLNVSHNGISELSLSHLPVLSSLTCSNNKLKKLELHEGPMRTLVARENCECKLMYIVLVLVLHTC